MFAEGKASFECKTPEETYKLGTRIGELLSAGDIVFLEGNLGAGKTHFTKGLMAAKGFDPDEVTSPSFSLVNQYPTAKLDIYHIDFWRLEKGAGAVFAVGLDEILESENSLVVIEWADRIGDSETIKPSVKVKIKGDGDEPRKIDILWLSD